MSFDTKTVESRKHTTAKNETPNLAKGSEAFAAPLQQKTTDAEASKKPKPVEVLAREATKTESETENSSPKAKSEGSGATKKTDDGRSSDREGELVIDPSVWQGDPLVAWKGPIGGNPRPENTLSNPNHTSGYAITFSMDVDGRFEKDNASAPHTNLLYTGGNNWPDAKGGAVPGSEIPRGCGLYTRH